MERVLTDKAFGSTKYRGLSVDILQSTGSLNWLVQTLLLFDVSLYGPDAHVK